MKFEGIDIDALPIIKPSSKEERLRRAKESVESISTIALSSSKMAYSTMLLAGFVFLLAYLTREGAPMPSPDVSLAFFLAIFAASGLAIAAICGLALTIPIYARALLNEKTRAALPYLFQKRPSVSSLRQTISQYLIVFSPFLILSGMFVRYVLAYTPDNAWTFFTPNYAAALIGAVILLAIWSITETNDRPLRACKAVLTLNASASYWLLLLWLMFFGVASQLYSNSDTPDLSSVALIFVATYLIMHFFFNVRALGHSEWKWPAIAFTLLLIFWEPGPAFFGATSLRLLGYGGGLPAHIIGRASSGAVLFEGDACVILKTGKELIYTDLDRCGQTFARPKSDSEKRRIRVSTVSSADIHPVGETGLPSPRACRQLGDSQKVI